MAAIALSDCTVRRKLGGDFEDVVVITPATADSGDTVDVANVLAGRTLVALSGWNITDAAAATQPTFSGTTITLAGSFSNKSLALSFRC